MKRARALHLTAVATALLRPFPARGQAPDTVRIAAATTDSFGEAFYAQDLGFFARAGLTAEITVFTNASAIVTAVAANAIDIGIADIVQVANGVLHGVPLGLFAGASLYSSDAPTTLMCVRKDSPLRTAKDLEGQTIGVADLHAQTTSATLEWLRLNGADPATVKLYELPTQQMTPALVRGLIQAAPMTEPFVTFGRDELRPFAKPLDVIAKSFFISLWFTTRERAAQQQRALLRRFARAIYDTARWANVHHAETLEVLARRAQLDIERVRTMNRVVWSTSLDQRLMQPVLDIGVRFKLIDRPVSAAELII